MQSRTGVVALLSRTLHDAIGELEAKAGSDQKADLVRNTTDADLRQLASEIRRGIVELGAEASTTLQAMLNNDTRLTKEEKKSELAVAGYFMGCTLCVCFLGFQVAIPLFLFIFLKIQEKEGWLLSLILPSVVTGIIYFVFYYLLHVPLYKGIFFE